LFGCATARKAGLNVLIITDEPAYRGTAIPSAGPLESIHPGVSSLLEKIDAAGAETAAASGHYAGIYVNDAYTALGEDEKGVWEGLHIRREIFSAIAHGFNNRRSPGITKVEDFILEQGRVKALNKSNIYATYSIDATGKRLWPVKTEFQKSFFPLCAGRVSRVRKFSVWPACFTFHSPTRTDGLVSSIAS
jgi:hypothetical protein